MIKLPPDWNSTTGGAITARLLEQATEYSLGKQFSICLIGSCLDLAVDGIFRRTKKSVQIKLVGDHCWQLGDWIYEYFHQINNTALSRAVEMSSCPFHIYIIVPPKHETIFWQACLSVVGRKAPSILAIDSLVNFRILFSLDDYAMSYERVMMALFRRYNQRALEMMKSESISIDLPSAWYSQA